MAKVETTLTLEQLDAALELNGKLRAFDAGYAKGFAAGMDGGMGEPSDEELLNAVIEASFKHGIEEVRGIRKDVKKAKLECAVAIMALSKRLKDYVADIDVLRLNDKNTQ